MREGGRVKGLVRAHNRSAEPRPLDAPGSVALCYDALAVNTVDGTGAEPGRRRATP